jgi:hypothetical protein
MKWALISSVATALVAVTGACTAQELGRLFFTAEQREALDARRKARVPDKPAAPVVASPTTRLDGYVQRSGGRSTVFVNGEPLPEGSADAPRIDSGRADGRIPIAVGEGAVRYPLKPGEILDRGSGEVTDVLGPSGEIKVQRRGN